MLNIEVLTEMMKRCGSNRRNAPRPWAPFNVHCS